MDGHLYQRGERGYEDARRAAVWNGRKPDRFPELIVVASTEDDVAATVRIAREKGMRIAVRSGGHSWVGAPVRDGGILLDLSELQEIAVDPAARTAAVQSGVVGAALDAALAEHGLFFPVGHCPDVGLAGFLLGGGYGWNSKNLGPACFSIEAVDVVTADGELVHADDENHPDILWAVRGGGPGIFVIVTRFHLRLHPRPSAITQTTHLYPADAAADVLRWAMTAPLSPKVQLVVMATIPPIEGFTAPIVLLTATVFVDAAEEARELLAPLDDAPVAGRALMQQVQVPKTMDELFAEVALGNPKGMRYAADNMWTAATPDELVPVLAPLFEAMPNPRSHVILYFWGQERTMPVAAWSSQAPLYLALYGVWEDEADDDRIQAWVRGSIEAVATLSAGTQFGDSDLSRRFDRPLSDANLARMEELRGDHDPDGLFHGYLVDAVQAPLPVAAGDSGVGT